MAESLRSSWWNVYDSWPLDRVEAFDSACDQMEAAWTEGSPPDLSSALEDVPLAERPVWLAEFLAIEIGSRWQRDEPLTLDEFLARFPNSAETVQQVWTETSPQLRTVVRRKEQTNAGQSKPKPGRFFRPEDIVEGRYKIDGLRGSGGMAELYKARRLSDHFSVAIKVLMPSPGNAKTGDDDWFLNRFRQEMQIGQCLRHPHLVTALDFIEAKNRPPIIVMDWIEGRTLNEEISLHRPMPWNIASEVIRQAADGLGFAWQKRQLIHRDIKPSNLMLTPEGQVSVLDFGLARASLVPSDTQQTGMTSIVERFGTADFTAPEQWDGVRDVGPSVDVYSLGATLFYLLTGAPPFASVASTVHDRINAHRTVAAPDVRSKCPGVPSDLSQLIAKMLSKEPDRRPADAAKVALQLKPWTETADLSNWYATGIAIAPLPAGAIIVAPQNATVTRRQLLSTAAASVSLLAIGGWQLSPWWLSAPKILELKVSVFERLPGDSFRMRGEIGTTLSSAAPGDEIRISLRLSVPAYVQVFEAHPDGTIRPLLNCDTAGETNQETQLGRVSEVNFPRQDHFRLDSITGLEAFVILASRCPIPKFDDWKQSAGLDGVWKPQPTQSGVWCSENGRIVNVSADEDETPRGQIVSAVPEPLSQVFETSQSKLGSHIQVAVVAFPVKQP